MSSNSRSNSKHQTKYDPQNKKNTNFNRIRIKKRKSRNRKIFTIFLFVDIGEDRIVFGVYGNIFVLCYLAFSVCNNVDVDGTSAFSRVQRRNNAQQQHDGKVVSSVRMLYHFQGIFKPEKSSAAISLQIFCDILFRN